MGCFGYICKGCGTPINGDALTGGEKCVMIHVRHGKEIGRAEGHYDEYGRVVEQNGFPEEEQYRGDSEGPNGHSAICNSEFALEDSYYRLQGLRVHKGEEMTFAQYAAAVCKEMRTTQKAPAPDEIYGFLEKNNLIERSFRTLPLPKRESYSGTAAWHSSCYRLASAEEKADLTPSESDPDQSWGKIRKKYL